MIAQYRTERGAERYAGEIAARFPTCRVAVVPHGFRYGVLVTRPDGKSGMADKRPVNYGKQEPKK